MMRGAVEMPAIRAISLGMLGGIMVFLLLAIGFLI